MVNKVGTQLTRLHHIGASFDQDLNVNIIDFLWRNNLPLKIFLVRVMVRKELRQDHISGWYDHAMSDKW